MLDTEGQHQQGHNVGEHLHDLGREGLALKVDLHRVTEAEQQGAGHDLRGVVPAQDGDGHRDVAAAGGHVAHEHVQLIQGQVGAAHAGQSAADEHAAVLDAVNPQAHGGRGLWVLAHHAQAQAEAGFEEDNPTHDDHSGHHKEADGLLGQNGADDGDGGKEVQGGGDGGHLGVEPLLFQMSCISRVVTARASRFSPMPLMTWLTL